jgi:hypothetical protein
MSVTKTQLLKDFIKLADENAELYAEIRILKSKEDTHTGILNYLYSSKLSQSKDEVYERWLQMKDNYVKK